MEIVPRHPDGIDDLIVCDECLIERSESEAEVEVLMCRFWSTRWDRMDVEVDEVGQDRLHGDTRLLSYLSGGRSDRRSVPRIDVSAGLKPPIEPSMVDEQE